MCPTAKPNFHIVSVSAESMQLSGLCRSIEQHINQTNSHISSLKAVKGCLENLQEIISTVCRLV